MRFRRSRGFIAVLALLLNLGGGPMAWAHAFGGAGACHDDPPAAAVDASECHGHDAASQADSKPVSHPCCEGGGCACAAPALGLTLAAVATPAPRPEFVAARDTSALLSRPIDDRLRPPIR